jgi:hypothetical protein
MELFKNTRLKIGNNILLRKSLKTKRKVFYSNINRIKVIGIVWDSSNPLEFTCLSKFYQKMHERNIEVKILGYFNGKDLPSQYTAIRYLTFIRKNEVNSFYVPKSDDANKFLYQKFDVLIDINFKKLFPLYYISSLSAAGFKVGLFVNGEESTPFDLMMEIQRPVNIDNYLTEILNYLEMINSGSEIKVAK